MYDIKNLNIWKQEPEKSSRDTEFMEAEITELNLSTRSFNCLKRAGIHTIGEVIKLIEEDEEGLLQYCSEEGLDIRFYSEEELLKAEGSFSSSEFVRKITGVESVCERSAVTSAGPEPELIIKKQVRDRVTVAAAVSKEKLRFE